MKTTYLVAWDMLTRSNQRRTYTHRFNSADDAEKFYQSKMQTRSTIEIWSIKTETIVEGNELRRNHEYIHEPKYVWK